ncbi:hypothetical protein [Lacticaseibacillus brantae]|uniref:Uncharacterized protein n=1 Tax=Lacticaseibacillus brantae DSM 23927 TaxID=1423727 RepID=A0A0R2B686_9LACO|nr:hypothetical protein [Lacticaseibacillus brantae]KRM71123.1 hypothetical protein FC34_GL000844 [Lacticaseibacillus brantae DSM 23927]
MITIESGAQEVINEAEQTYLKKFGESFPFMEYLNVTSGGAYDFSVAGAYRLKAIILQAIADNRPVPRPKGYEERVY